MPIPKNFTVIDLETTGPISEESHVIEIGIVRVEDGKIVKTYESLIRPPVPVPGPITHLTGLQDDDLKDAPRFHEIAGQIEAFFTDAVFTAHNAPFDFGFLSLEFLRLGKRFLKPVLCTKELAARLLPGQVKLGLDALSELFQIPTPKRHRALPDAEITAQVLLKLLENEKVEKELENVLISPEESHIRMPEDDFFSHLPQKSGVYRFLSENGKILFVGSGQDVRLKVSLHFIAQVEDKKERELCARVDQIDFTETSSLLEAEVAKAKEVRNLKPKFNFILKEWHPGAYLWISQETFPHLYVENESASGETARSLGPYPSRRALEKLLEYAKVRFKLCDYKIGHFRRPRKHYPSRRACGGVAAGFCEGACVGKLTPEAYQERVREAAQFIGLPLSDQEEDRRSFLKIVKAENTHNFSGGWKTRNLLTRLLKDIPAQGPHAEAPYWVEEGFGSGESKMIFLIQEGLLRKSWMLTEDIPEDLLRSETSELLKTHPVREKEEAEIERLVIREYLKRSPRIHRILPFNVLASPGANS